MLSAEWIDKQMVYLTSRLGVYGLEKGEDFFFEPTGGFYGFISQGRIEALNEAMKMLGEHISSLTVPVIEDWESPTNYLTTSEHDFACDMEEAGIIMYDGPHRSRIKIGFVNKHSPYVMGAILAHELTHHFLFNKNIGYPEIDENERLTDFATAYLGLGKLTLNGYEPIKWTIKRVEQQIKYSYRVGYLWRKDMAKIIKHISDFRKIPINIILKNLTDSSSQLVIKAFYDIVKDKPKNVWREKLSKFVKRISPKLSREDGDKNQIIDYPKPPTAATIVIMCINCKQKMRIPVVSYNIRVKCPSCHSKSIMKPKTRNNNIQS
jgi:DNA-directed RNA polymerase subunit RPC12/RpoP